MKKRILALMLSVFMILCVTACSKDNQENGEIPIEETNETQETAEEETEIISFEDALALLEEESPEASSMLAGGFEAIDKGEGEEIDGEACRRIDLYRYIDDTDSESISYFSISTSGLIYYSNDIENGEWHLING